MFTLVLYINLQVMTPIQINSSRRIVCKWILWLDATEHLQLILSERNDSIPLIRLLCSHFQSCQTCSFVLGFIPALGEPAWVLPQLVLEPRPRLARLPGLEWLPVWARLNSWSGMVSRGDGSNAKSISARVKSEYLLLTFLASLESSDRSAHVTSFDVLLQQSNL